MVIVLLFVGMSDLRLGDCLVHAYAHTHTHTDRTHRIAAINRGSGKVTRRDRH